jgi:cytochrome c-type biogenesis protein CcmI
MTVIAGLLLAIAAIAFVAYPLLGKGEKRDSRQEKRRAATSRRKIAETLAEELELDYEMGNISEEQFQEVKQEYAKEVSAPAKVLEQPGAGEPIDDEIEQQVLRRRQEQAKAKKRFCSSCGAKGQEGDKFCRKCGTEL